MKHRFLFSELESHLEKKQISLIVGPRQVGKTTLMQQLFDKLKKQSENAFFITLEEKQIRQLFNENPENLFQYLPPLSEDKRNFIFIDEIQYLDDPSNFLKYNYDKYHGFLKFIISGSSSFYIDKKFTDSLSGRKKLFKLPSLSFPEFVFFKERGDIVPYINSGKIPLLYHDTLNKLMHEYLIYGSYPEVVLENNIDDKKSILKELATSYIKKDISESNLQSPELYFDLLQIIAIQTGSLFNTNSVSTVLKKSNQTIDSYIHTMKKSFHITEIRPFHQNISKEIRKMPKLYFNDLGLRNFFAKNFNPIAQRNDKGVLFENFVFRRFYDKYDEFDIQFWRTQKKHEIDFIINRKSAFEVKFSDKQFNKKKYLFFTEQYPEIKLELIHYKNINSLLFDND